MFFPSPSVRPSVTLTLPLVPSPNAAADGEPHSDLSLVWRGQTVTFRDKLAFVAGLWFRLCFVVFSTCPLWGVGHLPFCSEGTSGLCVSGWGLHLSRWRFDRDPSFPGAGLPGEAPAFARSQTLRTHEISLPFCLVWPVPTGQKLFCAWLTSLGPQCVVHPDNHLLPCRLASNFKMNCVRSSIILLLLSKGKII